MKKNFFFFLVLIAAALACSLPQVALDRDGPAQETPIPETRIAPSETAVPAAETPAAMATQTAPAEMTPSVDGAAVSYGPVRFVFPPGLASGVSGSQFPRAEEEEGGPWNMTPGHTQIELTGYPLQGKFHQPRIYVFPAQAYAEMFPAAFESIRRLDNILYGPNAPDVNGPLPAAPFFNAAQVFASNVQAISFQNGSGVRFLTEYAQYNAPVNNQDLFYHFQGLTRDGSYYVIAILPISSSMLAETGDPGAALPAGGVAFPDINNPQADFQGYYAAVSGLLDAAPPEAFAPATNQLDLLIQSLEIIP